MAWQSRSRASSRSRISDDERSGGAPPTPAAPGLRAGATGRPRLLAAIRTAIRAGGPLTFAAFMDLALYHPRYGYYSALRAPPGPRGDFYTSPETHPAFGALVARQLQEVWERLGRPHAFVVEEWGAGSGQLAADILAAAPALAPELAASLTYTIVERSGTLRRAQQRLLRPWGERVRWAEFASPNCVLAHELLDAFAVHRVVRRGDALHELYVDLDGESFREVEGPPSTPALDAYFARLDFLPLEGAVAEVNLAALGWLRGIAGRLERGVVLIFDYAHPAELLYSARYPRGTLRTYYRHSVGGDPYVRIGWQDLTTHLDLTSLLLEGRAAGLTPLGLARQRDFLQRLGLGASAAAVRAAGLPAAETRASLAGLEALARPGGLGDHWVVGFGRGLPGPLHGLDEAAAPLPTRPPPTFLRPRLGWGGAQTRGAPR